MATSSPRPPLSLRARLLLVAVIWCGLAISLTAVVLIGLFRDHLLREADAEISDQVVELVALTRLDRAGAVRLTGSLSGARFDRPFSGWAWQIRRGEAVLAQSASLGPLSPGAPVLTAPAGAVGLFADDRGRRLRGLARAVAPRFHTERLVFAVARPQDEIDAAVEQFRLSVLIALGLLGAGLVATAVAALWIGLRPLRDLRARIATMRAGRVPPPRPWPREIAPIAAELEELRRHTERVVERGRGLAADLAHAIKTPLSVIRQQAEDLPADHSTALRRQADRIGLSLDRHLGRASAGQAAYGSVDVATCVEDLARALARARPDRTLLLEREIQPGLVFRGDEADLFEILGNPLDNAWNWAEARLRISARDTGEALCIEIEDDGPGIPDDERAAIIERGRRLDEAKPGQGLGLAILRDLTELYGGELRLGQSRLGGLSVAIRLPGR